VSVESEDVPDATIAATIVRKRHGKRTHRILQGGASTERAAPRAGCIGLPRCGEASLPAPSIASPRYLLR
jgi:hypothetical protein